MATADNFPDKCAVCQEEYDPHLPRDQLDVVRPTECAPVHFVHKQCGLPWFRKHKNCPVCRKSSIEIVDFHGHTVASVSSSAEASRSDNSEEIDLAYRAAVYGPLFLLSLPIQEQVKIARDFLNNFAAGQSEQRICGLCNTSVNEDNRALVIPCKHELHHTCLFSNPLLQHMSFCPVPSCHQCILVAGDPLCKRHGVNLNPPLLSATLHELLILDPNIGPNASNCQLCGQNAANEERVIIPCCHVFHRRCFDERVGSSQETVRLCPKADCKRQCVTVTPLAPRSQE